MPELPEAETIARMLHELLAGETLGQVIHTRRDMVHGDPRPLSKLLPGRCVCGVRRRAKRVILSLEPTAELVFHLGMSGRIVVASCDDVVEKHTHLRVEIRDRACELRFCDPRRFGGIWCLAGGTKHVGRVLGELGIEPLEAVPADFQRVVNRRRQIKALLLDQHVIAGLGNIYVDESLFAAGIHPQTMAEELGSDRSRRLLCSIKSILTKAIELGGSTLADYRKPDGSKGAFQDRHRVYQHEGKPCRKCSALITRIIVGGRSTFFCPACQPAPPLNTVSKQ